MDLSFIHTIAAAAAGLMAIPKPYLSMGGGGIPYIPLPIIDRPWYGEGGPDIWNGL